MTTPDTLAAREIADLIGLHATEGRSYFPEIAARIIARYLPGETCWFVERKCNADQKRWLAGFDNDESAWTNDPNRAIRFCRERDANAMCVSFSVLMGVGDYGSGSIFDGIGEATHYPQPTEHVWPEPTTASADSLLAAGLADVAAGRVHDHEDVKKELA